MTSISKLLDCDKKIDDNVTTKAEYAYPLKIDDIQLSTSALDDYQRLFFTTFVLNHNMQQNADYRIKIGETVYKSTLMPGILRPPYLPDDIVDPEYDFSLIEKKIHKTAKRNKSDNLLYCVEYSLPNVNISKSGQPIELDLSKLDFKYRNSFKISNIDQSVPILNGKIFFDDDPNHQIIPPQKANEVERELVENVDSDNVVYAITKNKQYKMRNIIHKNTEISNIVNSNNGVIWCNRTDYVFLTGIWRLYQDVINGLCKHDRYLMEADNVKLQKYCESEFEYILENLITSKPKTTSNKDINDSEFQTKKLFKYSELYWHNSPKSLKNEILDYYKNYLINEKNVPVQFLHDMTNLPLVKRGKGGFIRIQGIWLPRELARPLCILFAYPIRYLLTPVFGPEFPKDCENWFHNVHSLDKELKLTPLMLHYPSVSFQNIILNNLRAAMKDNAVLNKKKTQTKKKRKKNEPEGATGPIKKQTLPFVHSANNIIQITTNLINSTTNNRGNSTLLPPISNLNHSANYAGAGTPNSSLSMTPGINYNCNVTSFSQPKNIVSLPPNGLLYNNSSNNNNNNICPAAYNTSNSNIMNIVTPLPSKLSMQHVLNSPSPMLPIYKPTDSHNVNTIPSQPFMFNNPNSFDFTGKNGSFNPHFNNDGQSVSNILPSRPMNQSDYHNSKLTTTVDMINSNKINKINTNNESISSSWYRTPHDNTTTATTLSHGNNLILNQSSTRTNNSISDNQLSPINNILNNSSDINSKNKNSDTSQFNAGTESVSGSNANLNKDTMFKYSNNLSDFQNGSYKEDKK